MCRIVTRLCLLLGDMLFDSIIMLIETYSSDRGSLVDKKDGKLFNLLANVYSFQLMLPDPRAQSLSVHVVLCRTKLVS